MLSSVRILQKLLVKVLVNALEEDILIYLIFNLKILHITWWYSFLSCFAAVRANHAITMKLSWLFVFV